MGNYKKYYELDHLEYNDQGRLYTYVLLNNILVSIFAILVIFGLGVVEVIPDGGYWENYKWHNHPPENSLHLGNLMTSLIGISLTLIAIRAITKKFYFTFSLEHLFLF
jgi:hypothetical protein